MPTRRVQSPRLVAMVALLGALACRHRTAEQTGDGGAGVETLTFDSEVEVEYADLRGRFLRAPRPGRVPIASRGVLRVIEPIAHGAPASDDRKVHVVDLRRPSPSGLLATRLMSRDAFERLALAALPPGAASRVEIPGAGPVLAGSAQWNRDGIVLYGMAGCGACQQALDFLRARQLEVEVRDVAEDADAAAELAAKAADLGIAANRVPVIDVDGRLLVGFDRERLNTLLGVAL